MISIAKRLVEYELLLKTLDDLKEDIQDLSLLFSGMWLKFWIFGFYLWSGIL